MLWQSILDCLFCKSKKYKPNAYLLCKEEDSQLWKIKFTQITGKQTGKVRVQIIDNINDRCKYTLLTDKRKCHVVSCRYIQFFKDNHVTFV